MTVASKRKRLPQNQRIQILDEIDLLFRKCNECPKKKLSMNHSIVEACGGCPVYEGLKVCGEKLSNSQKENDGQRRTFTDEEDQLIIDTFKEKGIYKGFYKDIAYLLDREPKSIKSRVQVLTKKGVFE